MIQISWGTIKSLLIFFGPFLLPKIIAWYKDVQRSARNRNVPIVDLPTRSLLAVVLLTLSAVLFALSTLPIFSPENVFHVTRSNPTSTANLILSRLATLRPLTQRDEVLYEKFGSKASKLLYYKYGPDALLDCPFCNSKDPNTYLLYALPAVALPHLINAFLSGLSTSEFLTGRAGSQFRAPAAYATLTVAAADLYFFVQWDHAAGNERARILDEITFFYWQLRTYRYLALAAVDLLLAGALLMACTNRGFLVSRTTSERIDTVTAGLGKTRAQMQAAGVVKNTTARDGELRAAEARYWAHEVMITQEAMESEEVVESMHDAVENRRIDLEDVDKVAEGYARDVLTQALRT